MVGLKVVVGLGNPGPEYADTRHNVGWWLLDRIAEDWGIGRFKREGQAAVATVRVGEHRLRLVKPLTYMNRSGAVVGALKRMQSFDFARDLLVVVDDVALDPGRARFRPEGSAGGHNGLKSIQSALGTQQYARLRIGVGAPPPGREMAEYVLSRPSRAERESVLEIFPSLVEGVRIWMAEGIEAAMNRCNR